MFQLAASDKYITVSQWQGTTRIHIRNYFNTNGGAPGGGELIPTKKGVALTIDEWKALKGYVDHIDAMIAFSEDDRILGQKPTMSPPPPPPSPPLQLQSLIPEPCQYKPPSSEVISKQLLQIRKATPYQRPYEPEPFDR